MKMEAVTKNYGSATSKKELQDLVAPVGGDMSCFGANLLAGTSATSTGFKETEKNETLSSNAGKMVICWGVND